MKKLYAVAFISIFLLLGCATDSHTKTLSPSQRRALETKEFDAEYDDVFKATVLVLRRNNYDIIRTDNQNGIISARKRNDYYAAYQDASNDELTVTIDSIFEVALHRKVIERISFLEDIYGYDDKLVMHKPADRFDKIKGLFKQIEEELPLVQGASDDNQQ